MASRRYWVSVCAVKAFGSTYTCACVFAYVFVTEHECRYVCWCRIELHFTYKMTVCVIVCMCWPLINDQPPCPPWPGTTRLHCSPALAIHLPSYSTGHLLPGRYPLQLKHTVTCTCTLILLHTAFNKFFRSNGEKKRMP